MRWRTSPPMSGAPRPMPSGRLAHASQPRTLSKLAPRNETGSGRVFRPQSVNSSWMINNAGAPSAGTSSTTDLCPFDGQPGCILTDSGSASGPPASLHHRSNMRDRDWSYRAGQAYPAAGATGRRPRCAGATTSANPQLLTGHVLRERQLVVVLVAKAVCLLGRHLREGGAPERAPMTSTRWVRGGSLVHRW